MQRFVIITSILTLLLVSCSLLADEESREDADCLDVIALPTPSINNEHRFYVILVEGSEEYRPYREQGVQVISKVFSSSLEQGDQIAAIWMEVSSMGSDDALFFTSEIEALPTPEQLIESEPQIIPIPTPLSDGVTPASRIQHENIVHEVEEKNEKIREEHKCKTLNPIREINNSAISSWEIQSKERVNNVIEEFSNNVNAVNPDYMSVFESLKLASDILGEVCVNGDYKDCQLIIISNMVDWRSTLQAPEVVESINNMNIDFSHTSVSVIWPDCNFFSNQFQSKCEERKEIWTKNFSKFNASEELGNLIFLNMSNATDKLTSFIGE